MLEKCFTICKENATNKPALNMKDVALERAKTEEFDWIIIKVKVKMIKSSKTV